MRRNASSSTADPAPLSTPGPSSRGARTGAGAGRRPNNTRSVERVLNILQVFTTSEPEFTATQLSRKLDLNKSTVHRLAGALEARGLLWRNRKTRAYSLGPAILDFVDVVLDQRDIASRSLPHMWELRDRTKETVGLNIRVGRQRVCVAQVESPHELRMRLDIGKSLPLYCGAASKVLLADMEPDEIEAVIRETRLEPLGPGSIRDPDVLRRQLRAIRENGCATSKEERIAGGVTVAAPLRDRTGKTIASLSVYGPMVRVDGDCLTGWMSLVTETAETISRELGFVDRGPKSGRDRERLAALSGGRP